MKKLHLHLSGLGQYHFALAAYNLDDSVYYSDLSIFTWVSLIILDLTLSKEGQRIWGKSILRTAFTNFTDRLLRSSEHVLVGSMIQLFILNTSTQTPSHNRQNSFLDPSLEGNRTLYARPLNVNCKENEEKLRCHSGCSCQRQDFWKR